MQNEYFGAIHIHSTFSDGTADIQEISKYAKKAGLQWIIITDHNNMDIQEGFYNGVCVLKGEEISLGNNNHYLALGIENFIDPFKYDVQGFVDAVREQKGFGIAAHPDEILNRKNNYPPIRWLDKSIIPDGVEIWNWFSTWADNYSDKNIFYVVYSFVFRHHLVKYANPDSLTWWDMLNNSTSQIIPAICGIDAHALKIKKFGIPVKIFPYSSMLKTLTNVIYINEPLSQDFKIQKQQILTALKNAQNLIVNRHVSKDIPQINVQNLTTTVKSGEKIQLDDKTFLNVNFNQKVLIKIFYNGVEIHNTKNKELKFKITKKGKYRVELYVGKYGFAYSNPILVE